MRNFRPVSDTRRKKAGTSSGAKFEKKANMAKHKVITFAPIIPLVTLIAVLSILHLNGMLMTWKILQAMYNDALRTSEFISLSGAGNRAEVFIWPNFQPELPRSRMEKPKSREPSQPTLSFSGKARSRKLM